MPPIDREQFLGERGWMSSIAPVGFNSRTGDTFSFHVCLCAALKSTFARNRIPDHAIVTSTVSLRLSNSNQFLITPADGDATTTRAQPALTQLTNV
jgi:hypothetical protein